MTSSKGTPPQDSESARAGLYLESTEEEQLGLLEGETKLVGTVFAANVPTVAATMMVAEAAQLMRDCGIGALPVSKDGHVAGMVTQTDLIFKCMAEWKPIQATTIEGVFTRLPMCCHEDDRLSVAAELMVRYGVDHLPVVAKNRTACGVLTLTDLGKSLGIRAAGEVLRRLSEKRLRESNNRQASF